MTSYLYFEVRFRHNQLQKPLFGQIMELQVTNMPKNYETTFWLGGGPGPRATPLPKT